MKIDETRFNSDDKEYRYLVFKQLIQAKEEQLKKTKNERVKKDLQRWIKIYKNQI